MNKIRGYGTAFGEPNPVNQTVMIIDENKCPKCSLPLNLKRNRASKVMFLGCSGWPNCSYTRPF
jgi:ssDNA-binding Zn-finger/Zn-ribbon topoisomerase 1